MRLKKGWFGILVATALPWLGLYIGLKTVAWAIKEPNAEWPLMTFLLAHGLGWFGFLWMGLTHGEEMGRKKAQAEAQ